jgi:predicted nucleic acid-binding protein
MGKKTGAVLIVTGDKDLLSMGSFEAIRIVTPRQYLIQLQLPHGPSASHSKRRGAKRD